MPNYHCEQFTRDQQGAIDLGSRRQAALDLFIGYRQWEEKKLRLHKPVDPASLTTIFDRQLQYDISGVVLLVEDSTANGVPVGIATIGEKSPDVKIFRIAYIRPSRRGQHLLTPLTDCVEDLSRQTGGKSLEVVPISRESLTHFIHRGYTRDSSDPRRFRRQLV